MKQMKTPFQPLSTDRLHEMAQVAVQYRQRVSPLMFMKRLMAAERGAWVLAPTGAFAVVMLVMFALYAGPLSTPEEDLIAQVEQADVLVMLEENLY